MSKHLFGILGVLLWTISSLAQGTLKGTVTDKKTGESLPFGEVRVFEGGTNCVDSTQIGLDGSFILRNLPRGTYNVLVASYGYKIFKRKGVRVKDAGFTVMDAQLEPQSADSLRMPLNLTNFDSVSIVDTVKKPLSQYEIVNPDLAMLLDRVIEGREHTYFWNPEPRKPKPSPEGTTFNLCIVTAPSIDTVKSYLYKLYLFYNVEMKDIYELEEDIRMPQALNGEAPEFSFDSATTFVDVWSTYDPQTYADGTYGFVEYRGCIFFITMPPDHIDPRFLRLIENAQRKFRYLPLPPFARYDPETWSYTCQQGHWYRWRELPNGY
jgi:hypothetical protein